MRKRNQQAQLISGKSDVRREKAENSKFRTAEDFLSAF
jgi:hypothetical protein